MSDTRAPPRRRTRKTTRTLAELAAFLDGTAPMDGVWFGERHPVEPGLYWWRKHVRAALDAAADEQARLRGRVEGLERALAECADDLEAETTALDAAEQERARLRERGEGLLRTARFAHTSTEGES